MRIGRFSADGRTRIGRFESDNVTDVSDVFTDFRAALSRPEAALEAGGDTFDRGAITHLPPTTARNAIFCAAVNYEGHATEGGNTVPDRPQLFLLLPRSLVGHRQPIAYYRSQTQELDYEAELAVVIGREARGVDPAEALSCVAGYTIMNDTTARDLQQLELPDGQVRKDWFSGKAMERTTPLGPYVVVDEIEDPQALSIRCRVNERVMQDDTTGMMVSSVRELIATVSQRVTLEPGDVIATGTPEGVGTYQDVRLAAGDTVTIEIEGIGTLENEVVAQG